MKLSKKKLFLIILIIFTIAVSLTLFFVFHKKQNTFNPISDRNNFYTQLNLALKTSRIETSSWQIRDFINQVEFTVSNDDNNFKVILSNQKNPLWQITSLQEVIKTAKIKQQPLKLVNLSAAHPYATFKNN
jgi:peptidoglycan hydrolase CwlO-like protein